MADFHDHTEVAAIERSDAQLAASQRDCHQGRVGHAKGDRSAYLSIRSEADKRSSRSTPTTRYLDVDKDRTKAASACGPRSRSIKYPASATTRAGTTSGPGSERNSARQRSDAGSPLFAAATSGPVSTITTALGRSLSPSAAGRRGRPVGLQRIRTRRTRTDPDRGTREAPPRPTAPQARRHDERDALGAQRGHREPERLSYLPILMGGAAFAPPFRRCWSQCASGFESCPVRATTVVGLTTSAFRRVGPQRHRSRARPSRAVKVSSFGLRPFALPTCRHQEVRA